MSQEYNEQPTVFSQERRVIDNSVKKHQREIEVFTGIFNAFTSGFNRIGSYTLTENNETELIYLLLVTRCFQSLRCSFDLMQKGYYSQAMSLIRTITEDWFICLNAQDNIKVKNILLTGKGKMPSYEKLATDADVHDIYEKDYRYQSQFTHSTLLSLKVLRDPKTNVMRVAPTYDEMLFLSCAESLMRVSILIAEILGRFLYSVDKEKAKSWDTDNGQYFKNTNQWLKELREKYGEGAI